MSTFTNTAREVEMPNGDVVVIHNAPTGGENTTSNIKKFKYDDNGHVTESTAADAEDLNLSGYSTPSSGSTDIGASDPVQTAIGKLDHQSKVNQSNISYTIGKVGKNLLNFADAEIYNTRTTYVKSDSDLVASAISNWAYVGFPIGSLSGNVSLSFKISNLVNSDATPSVRISKDVTGSDENLRVSFATNGTYNGNFNADGSNYYLVVYLNPSNDARTISLTFSECMVCDKALYDVDPSFEIYGRPNYDLTRLEAEDRAALVEQVDKGAKNLYDTSSFAGYSGNGMTLTNNGDGTITADGTVSIAFIGVDLTPVTLDAGTYVLSGCPSGGGDNSYMLQINSPSYVEDIGDGSAFTLTSSATVTVRIRITQTSTSITKMFKPMICTKAEWDISQQFEPHALQNYELTKLESEDRAALVEQVDKGAKNKFNPEKATTNPDRLVIDGNGYAFKSVSADTRTSIAFVLNVYDNNTYVRQLNHANITSTGLFSCTFVKASDFNFLRFGHSGAALDLQVTVDVSDLVNGETYVLSFNVTATNPSVLLAWNSTMICTKAKWDVSHNFEPYALPNYDLTRLQSEDRAALVEVVDKGAKNLFNPVNVVDLFNMTAGDDGYTYQSSDTDTRTYFAFSVDAYYNSTSISNLGQSAVYQNGIVAITFTKLPTFNRLKIGHSGVNKTIAIFVNVPDLENNKRYTVALNVTSYNPSVSLAWNHTMICTAEEWKLSQGFSEYSLPNAELTALEAEDRAALAEVVDNGAKNVLDGNWESTDMFTVNSDKSVTVNGTTGESAASLEVLGNGSGGYVSNNYGGYVLSGCIDGSTSSYSLCVIYSPNGITWGAEQHQTTADTPIIIRNDYAYIRIVVLVRKNQTITNKTVYPMLCKKPLYDVSPKFVPYRPSYDAVVADVAKAQYTVQTADFACSAADTYEYTGLSVTVPAGHIYEIAAYDNYNNNVPVAIAIATTNSNVDITTTTTMMAESSGNTSENTYFSCRSVMCITNLKASNETYYLFVKRNGTGSNKLALMWRQIV